MQSATVHMPPESVRILAFTASMYAMVRKVVVPALSSVVKFVLRSTSLNFLPTLVVAMYEFKRVVNGETCGSGRDVAGGGDSMVGEI